MAPVDLPEQFKHQTVNHSKEYKLAEGCCTNTKESKKYNLSDLMAYNIQLLST